MPQRNTTENHQWMVATNIFLTHSAAKAIARQNRRWVTLPGDIRIKVVEAFCLPCGTPFLKADEGAPCQYAQHADDKAHVWVGSALIPVDDAKAMESVKLEVARFPDAGWQIPSLEVYCFTGDTEFMTRDGVRTFADTVGTSQLVLTQEFIEGRRSQVASRSDGRWVEAEIRSFGEQRVMSVALVRDGVRKVVRATPNHRWFASRSDGGAATARVVETRDLCPGSVLMALTPATERAASDRLRWRVESVVDHGEAEEVFCAVVPDTHSFALADYIWTHNCDQCRRNYGDVADRACEAAVSNEHLIGGPTGTRAKRRHEHDCAAVGCPGLGPVQAVPSPRDQDDEHGDDQGGGSWRQATA